MNHPRVNELALFATGDAPRLRGFVIGRHLSSCSRCAAQVAEFRDLHDDLTDLEMPEVNWNRLASEMRANIRLGIEAGECVRHTETARSHWRLGLAAACACVIFLAGAGYFLRDTPAPAPQTAATLATTPAGVELRSGSNSFTLLNHDGAVSSQTASAQGAVRSRSIDAETGAVTITNVYLAE